MIETLKNYIPYIQLAVGILMTALILLQSRGAGVGSLFGGADDVFRAKRGVEKVLHYTTIVLAFLFVATALANLLLSTKTS